MGTSTGLVDERKKKKTMDKAMGIHLSRQLQLRLQYAKLKVDHGWHKQNLNEVENLYFRHSHIRGPRPSANSVVPLNPTSIPAATSRPNSSLSFMQNVVGKQSDTVPEHSRDGGEKEKAVSPPAQPPILQLLPSPLPASAPEKHSMTQPISSTAQVTPVSSNPTHSASNSSGYTPVVQPMQRPAQTVPPNTFTFKQVHPVQMHPPSNPQNHVQNNSSRPILSHSSSSSIPAHPASQSQPRPVSNTAPTPAPAPAAPPKKPSPSTSTSSLQTSNSSITPPTKPAEPFQFGTASSSSSLTYDSFWSSHLASRTRSLTSLSGSSAEDVASSPAPTNFLQRRLSDVQIAQSLGPSFAEYMSSHNSLNGGIQGGKQNSEVVNRVGAVGNV